MKRFIRALIFVALAASSGEVVFAAMPKLDEGNAYYEKGQWDQALDSYQQVFRQGFEGPELFYDMGNAYYRKGDRGRAALWYERALRLKPRDSDIGFNLKLARSHLKDNDRPFLDDILFFFTDGELGGIVLAFLYLACLLIFSRTVGWLGASSSASAFLTISVCCAVIFGSWFGLRTWRESRAVAVVTAAPGEVRNGPGSDYPVGFTVPEGTSVSVLQKRLGWWQVGVAEQGLKGWMPSDQAEEIRWRNSF
jgi:tetratricopeptide (TPR) repeat protein